MTKSIKKKAKINWGILSTGTIATKMAQAIMEIEDANLLAVASRNSKKSQEFAQKFDIPRSYDSYEKLIKDADIDIVYIGTPNTCHYENILSCLNNGKSVLCEKPMVLNEKQAKEVIELAEKKNLFLMEAHKSCFIPGIKKLKELIEEDSIGKITSVCADFCIDVQFNPKHRLYDLNLGGGALLDLGVYNILFAIHLLGFPVEINSNTVIGESGVDICDEITLKHSSGAYSKLNCAINKKMPNEAIVCGQNGYIKLSGPFHQTQVLFLKSGENPEIKIDKSFECNDLFFEAQRATECLKNGETECFEFPLRKTLEILKVTDYIRKKCNLKYPDEIF